MTQELRRAVLEAESRRCAAMLAGDANALDRLLDPRLHFSHATGAVDDKQAYLAKIAAARIAYVGIEWSEQKVIPVGEVLSLTLIHRASTTLCREPTAVDSLIAVHLREAKTVTEREAPE